MTYELYPDDPNAAFLDQLSSEANVEMSGKEYKDALAEREATVAAFVERLRDPQLHQHLAQAHDSSRTAFVAYVDALLSDRSLLFDSLVSHICDAHQDAFMSQKALRKLIDKQSEEFDWAGTYDTISQALRTKEEAMALLSRSFDINYGDDVRVALQLFGDDTT